MNMYMYKIQAMWVFISLHEGILYNDLNCLDSHNITSYMVYSNNLISYKIYHNWNDFSSIIFSTGTDESLQMRKLHVEKVIVEERKIISIKLIENYGF